MKRLCLALVFLFLFSLAPGYAQSPTPLKSVRFLLEPGLTLVENNTFHYDAGIVDVIRTPRLDHTFTLENTTTHPLTISGLRGSCGCETLLLSKNGAHLPTVRLAPGEQAEIQLSVQLHSGQSGPARKYVWVDGPAAPSGQASPLATLEVDLTLRQSVLFTPSYLNFGKVEAGAVEPRTVTVSLDADLLPAAVLASDDPSLPPLRSTTPSVRVVPLGRPLRTELGGQPTLRQTYQVTLAPDAPAGRLTGDLRFSSLPSSDAFSQVSVSVSADISGALDCQPASVFFGSVPTGTPITRSVVLFTASAQSASALTVTSSAPWLRALLDHSPHPERHHVLRITLTKEAPPGSLQGVITVTLGKDNRLNIPVVAELTK